MRFCVLDRSSAISLEIDGQRNFNSKPVAANLPNLHQHVLESHHSTTKHILVYWQEKKLGWLRELSSKNSIFGTQKKRHTNWIEKRIREEKKQAKKLDKTVSNQINIENRRKKKKWKKSRRKAYIKKGTLTVSAWLGTGKWAIGAKPIGQHSVSLVNTERNTSSTV